MRRGLTRLARLFWKARYAVYSRDLYAPLRAGRGTRENPLSLDDLAPVQKALRRIEAKDPGQGAK